MGQGELHLGIELECTVVSKPKLKKDIKYPPYLECGGQIPFDKEILYTPPPTKGRTLYLVDSGPLAFFAMSRCESSPECLEDFINYAVVGGFLRSTPDFDRDGTIILLKDHKPYWKSLYFSDYKGKRGDKPAQFSPTMDLLNGFEGLTLAKKRYEADDYAGAIVRAFRLGLLTGYNKIVLWTLDTDWLMLVGNGVYWQDMRSYKVSFSREVLQSDEYIRAQSFFNGKERDGAGLTANFLSLPPGVRKYVQIPSYRDGETAILWATKWLERNNKPIVNIDHPYQICDIKCQYGDRSDNLVPTPVPRFLVDLYQPPIEWDLLTDGLVDAILSQEPNLNSQKAKECWVNLTKKGIWLNNS